VKELIPSNTVIIHVMKTKLYTGMVDALINVTIISEKSLLKTSLSVSTPVTLFNICIGMERAVICAIIHGSLMSKEIDISVPSPVRMMNISIGIILVSILAILQSFL